MNISSHHLTAKRSYPPSRNGSKLAEVEENLKQLFKKQQRGFGIPHKPIKIEKDVSPRKGQPQPQKPHPVLRNDPPQLTRKNMELFQKQQQHQKENQNGNTIQVNHGDTPVVMTQLDGHPTKKVAKELHDIEVAKLRNTIATYEINSNNLMKTLNSERDNYRVATKDLQRANESLKLEVGRIEKSFREVVSKREEQVRLNEKLRHENDDLLTKNLRLQHDLAQALGSVHQSDNLCKELRFKVEDKLNEQEQLMEQNKDLTKQLERLRTKVGVWHQSQETSLDRSVGHVVTCAVGKLIFVGSIIAVAVATFLHTAQAAQDTIDCDYELEPLGV